MKWFSLLSTRSRIWSDSDRWRNRCSELFMRMTRNILNHRESCLHWIFNSEMISQRKRHWKMNVSCQSLSSHYQRSESEILGDWKSFQLKTERCFVKTCCSISTVSIWESVDEKNCVVVTIQHAWTFIQEVGRCRSESEPVSKTVKTKTFACVHAQISNRIHSWIWICKTVCEEWRWLSVLVFSMIRKSFLSIKQIILLPMPKIEKQFLAREMQWLLWNVISLKGESVTDLREISEKLWILTSKIEQDLLFRESRTEGKNEVWIPIHKIAL